MTKPWYRWGCFFKSISGNKASVFLRVVYFLNKTIWLISWGGRFSNLVTGKLNVTKKIVIINNKWMCYFSIVGMASFVMN